VHGASGEDAFHLVLPSIPGYGLSGQPTELGWDSDRIGRAWAELMDRLGYSRYVAQGGDVAEAVTDAMGRQAPQGLLGIHINVLAAALGLTDHLPAEFLSVHAAADGRVSPAGLTGRHGGFTTFPGELWAAPRSWVEVVYPGLTYFNEVDKGGHFATWEELELFSEEIRAAFRKLR
jgi:pimeloyl-ACP methyl ester carboxylesterase